jgi:hypothetical protein
MAHTGHTGPPIPPAGDSGHVCYFQMIQGGMACACGETITAPPETDSVSRCVKAVEVAMRHEGLSDGVRERVINRLVYGDLLGPTARYKLNEEGHAISVTVNMSVPQPSARILASAVRELNERMGRVNGR